MVAPIENTVSLKANDYFERHLARLIVVLYYCGQPVSSLLDGETREVLSIWQLQRFDFWVREPEHLALALLHAYSNTPDVLDKAALQTGLQRLLADDQVDVRRVLLPGGPYNLFEDFDSRL